MNDHKKIVGDMRTVRIRCPYDKHRLRITKSRRNLYCSKCGRIFYEKV